MMQTAAGYCENTVPVRAECGLSLDAACALSWLDWNDGMYVLQQTSLETQIAELDDRCGGRQLKLGGSKKFHEFMREADDLEQWISEQMQVALSDDYGQDYEHLQVSLCCEWDQIINITSTKQGTPV